MSAHPSRRAWWRALAIPALLVAAITAWELLAPAASAAWRRLFPLAASGDGTWYISQMHPWIVQPGPGTCPICGMDLTPLRAEDIGKIAIDPVTVQNIGVRTITSAAAVEAAAIRTSRARKRFIARLCGK